MWSRYAALALVMIGIAGGAQAEDKDKRLYVVATAHLDTQWLWTIQDTIRECIPATLRGNFALFEKYPDYHFSFEGAFRYMLAREYYPEDYETLRKWIAAGRWSPCGSWVDAADTNIPAPESLIRHVLYGNRFFRTEFGRPSADVFLPDCFGFGYALPSVAAHCGLKGFSTQKLTWGSSVGVPFDVGLWQGVDGSEIVAALKPGDYVRKIREDWSRRKQAGPVGYAYFGVGDEGGAPDDESVEWLEKAIRGDGPVRVMSAPADEMYRELTPEEIAGLPRYRGELLMTRHGTGCYTSQAAMKRMNRKSEQLAASAERASVAADWLGGAAYPREKLREAWIRFLWHQFHDDLTGTSTPLAYPFSWNDEMVAQNQLAAVLGDAVGAVTRALDTQSRGVPLVVYNPLSIEREDVVEAIVRFPDGAPAHVRVLGPDGGEVPSQVVSSWGEEARLLFLARVPSVGFAVFDVIRSEGEATPRTGLSVTGLKLENARYAVTIDGNGDVASIRDKAAGRELLAGPARWELLRDEPKAWPEWEVWHDDISAPPRACVGAPVRVTVVERGPVRVAVRIERQEGGSTFVQTVRLAAGGAGDLVEWDGRIDWQTPATLVKAAFPLNFTSPRTTYDLGLGTIQRGANTQRLYEVPAQQWADLTTEDGLYGVAVLNDCKYGWDRPSANTLRLTLIHSPHRIEKDRGRHRFLYAVTGHAGDWREGRVPQLAARLNQPLVAFAAPAHPGPLGRNFSLLSVDSPQVMVSALKKAEDADEIVVRLFEHHGLPARGLIVRAVSPILSAREWNGMEDPTGAILAVEDGKLRLDLEPYRPRTIAIRLAPPEERLPLPESRPVPLEFDTDVVSPDADRADGDFDGQGRSIPAELLPAQLTAEGIGFDLGPKGAGEKNAVACRGQRIALPAGEWNRVYLLAAASGGDAEGEFRVGAAPVHLRIQEWTGFVGQSQSLVVGGKIVGADQMEEPYRKTDAIAWVGTHRHTPREGNEPYVFCYLFKYALDLPLGASRLTLPENPAIRVMAVTVARNENDRAVPASEIVDEGIATRIRPKGGLAIGPVTVTIASDRPDAPIRYTIDGGEPTTADTLYTGPFVLDRGATIRARAFPGGRPADYVAVRSFRFTKPRPAVKAGDFAPGVRWDYFEGEWRSVKEMASLAPVATGSGDTISLEPRCRDANFGFRFRGWLDVPRDGVYTIHMASDDGSVLEIGDEVVVPNDGLHGATERSGQIALAAGRHPLTVLYFQRGGDFALEVSWEGPGIPRQPLWQNPPGGTHDDR